ncbi:MAG: SET domain-containing protein-lysine N-methyltransferase [Candidatus Omnitrophica bacterium]|nr:SET domain-containing protein-lysine N-methyltransferase [Candidatus Omnitrophota bacterium]
MIKRFYPSNLPEFPYEPKSDRFAIRRISDNVGEGVIALTSFEPGDIAFAFTGFLTNYITQFTLKFADGLHIHDPYFMGKILHCCEPNTICDMSRRVFITVKPIAAGGIVTMDYAQTEDVLFKPFFCSCGALHCRGYVTGKLETVTTEADLLIKS